ncbi:hypothetical protein JCM3766R1_005995 [Sporobolomyces carnicolor]
MERKHISIVPDFVVPLGESPTSPSETNFLRLPHPRTHQPALFLPHERRAVDQSDSVTSSSSDGLLEVQKVALDPDKSRSWFLQDEIVSDGNLTILSPFDPVFLVLSYLSTLPNHFVAYHDLWEIVSQQRFPLAPQTSAGRGGKRKAEDDDDEAAANSFSDDIVKLSQLECVRERMEQVCETQTHESTTLYRLSIPLAVKLLEAKVARLCDSTSGVFGRLEPTEPGESVHKVDDGQVVKPFPTVSQGIGRQGVGSGQGLSEQIQKESREKYAIGVISNYLAPPLAQALSSAYKFSALDAFLNLNNDLGSSFLGTTYLPGRQSSKTSSSDDPSSSSSLGGGNAAAAAKKRKLEAKGSRGVEALKKVNTRGMKSLAEMFGKQQTAAAATPTAKGKKK